MNKRWGFREIVVYLHSSITMFGGLPGPREKSEKKKRNCILSQNLVGLNAHAQKKECIHNRLKFALAAATLAAALQLFSNSCS